MRSLPSQGSSIERATSSQPMKKTNLGMRTMEKIVKISMAVLIEEYGTSDLMIMMTTLRMRKMGTGMKGSLQCCCSAMRARVK